MTSAVTSFIFDLDGTLLDTLLDIANAANEALVQHGFPAHPVDAYRTFVGAGVGVLFERALPSDHRDPATLDRCVQGFRNTYARTWNVHTRPYPGIESLLDELAARDIACAVLSNKPHEFTLRCVEEYFAPSCFQVVFGARVGVPHKPDPSAALEILRILKRPAGECLYLGDSDVDMQTAVAAHLFPVAALWGFRGRAELEAAGAAALVERPAEVLELLGR